MIKNQVWDINGNLLHEEIVELQNKPHEPLNEAGALATLLVVTGNISIEDAANAIGATPEDLINEAQAWAVAAEMNNGN